MKKISKNLDNETIKNFENNDFSFYTKKFEELVNSNFNLNKIVLNKKTNSNISSEVSNSDMNSFISFHEKLIDFLGSVSNYDKKLEKKVCEIKENKLLLRKIDVIDKNTIIDLSKNGNEESDDFILIIDKDVQNLFLFTSNPKLDQSKSITFNFNQNNHLNIIDFSVGFNNYFFSSDINSIDLNIISEFSKINSIFKASKNLKATIRCLNFGFNEINAFISNKSDTNSNLTFRNIIKEDFSVISDSFLEGENVKSFLDIRNFNLGGKIKSLPSLTVNSNSSKLDHSMFIKNFREDELFYLSKNGIDLEVAKNLIVKEFFTSNSNLSDLLYDLLKLV